MITLALDPGRAKLIPANVSAQILPKTLFGEQYVSLTDPVQRRARRSRAGDVIAQDRSAVALESEKVIGDLLPLLQAVKPAELNATLTAMATALQGRGTELGQTLVALGQLPQAARRRRVAGHDVHLAAGHRPEQARQGLGQPQPATRPTCSRRWTTCRPAPQTLIDKQAALRHAADDRRTARRTSSASFLADNEQRLITVVDTSRHINSLLDEYTPEYTCMLDGADAAAATGPRTGIKHNQIQLSAQLYVAPPSFGAYVPGNEPKFITGLGPNCFGLPNPQVPFKVPANFRCLNDGAPLTADPCAQRPRPAASTSRRSARRLENAMVNSVVAGTSGTTPNKVPGMATLLVAPVAARGGGDDQMRGLLSPLIKLIVFLIVTTFATYVLGGDDREHELRLDEELHAIFTDVAGLTSGDDVRIAGVRVGTRHRDQDHQGHRRQRTSRTRSRSRSSPAGRCRSRRWRQLRYRNLVGQRYLDLAAGRRRPERPAGEGRDDPGRARRQPALDLTYLFNGFQPLFQGLDADADQRAVRRGHPGAAGRGRQPRAAADQPRRSHQRDRRQGPVIGDVVDNLASVLTAVGDRDTELSNLILQLQRFISGLAQDRTTIGNSIDSINKLATNTSSLLTQIRAPLAKDITDLTALTANLNKNSAVVASFLQQLPGHRRRARSGPAATAPGSTSTSAR